MYASASSPGGLMSAALGAIQFYQRAEATEVAQSSVARTPIRPEVALAAAAMPEAAPPGSTTRMPDWPQDDQKAVQANQVQAAGEVTSMVVARAQQAYAMQAAL